MISIPIGRFVMSSAVFVLMILAMTILAVACGSGDESGPDTLEIQQEEERSTLDDKKSDAEGKESGSALTDEDSNETESAKSDDSVRAQGKLDDDSEEPEEPEPTPEPIPVRDPAQKPTRGGAFTRGVFALLPGSGFDTRITAYNVASIMTADGVPKALRDEVVNAYGVLEGSCVFLDEIQMAVQTANLVHYVSGEFAVSDLRQALEQDGFLIEDYRGYEVLLGEVYLGGNRTGNRAVAILEERGTVILGWEDPVKGALKSLKRGTENFLDEDSHLRRVFGKARDGLKLRIDNICAGDFCQEFAASRVTALSDEMYAVDIELVVLMDSDTAADAVRDAVKGSIDGTEPGFLALEVLDITHDSDGEFVVVQATIDEESLRLWQEYRVPHTIIRKPGSPQSPSSPAFTDLGISPLPELEGPAECPSRK